MKIEEIQQVIDWASSVDMQTLDIKDQIQLMHELDNYAKAVKPIMLAYQVTSPQTFITRL